MLYCIEGNLEEKNNLFAIINVNGFSLRIFIPLSTYSNLPETGNVCKLFTEMVIGEKIIKLYGFYTKDEKNLFNALRKISKIGAQTAISVLSSLSVEQFYNIVSAKDDKMLTTIPGIGKKTALSIIVEFSSKLPADTVDNKVLDAALALENMGFTKTDALRIIQNIHNKNPNISIKDLIKEALRQSAKDVH